MKTICIVIISVLIGSSVVMASEEMDRPENCTATLASAPRDTSGKAVEQDNEEEEVRVREVQEG